MLIVIEAPGKLKKIREYSGSKVFATVGHYRDLPDKNLGVDLENLEPIFVPKEAKPGLLNELLAQARDEDVIIASDPDREGYAIGMMVWQDIKAIAKTVKRAEFREITEKSVKAEIARAVDMDKTNVKLYDAFLGRRVGDRLIGYLLSPVVGKKLGKDIAPWSVGRVQSPAIRLVVEREREIAAFKSGKYYLVGIECEKSGLIFTAWHQGGKIPVKTDAEALVLRLAICRTATALSVDRKKRQEMPKPPFETASLQMAASSQLTFAPEQCMKMAQDLYSAGLISYHRTDSVRIAPEFVEELRKEINRNFGENYLPLTPHNHKSKDSQADAHEGIRPTKVHDLSNCASIVAKESLSNDHARLYELIARRAMASQMAQALFDTTTLIMECSGERFKANGRVMLFDGFRKLWEIEEESSDLPTRDETTDVNQKLPDIENDEILSKVSDKMEEKSTKAPPRYTEASLVDKLKKLGIGRPSTYAAIMKAITGRQYVVVKSRKLHATQRGERLLKWLETTTPWLIDYEATKKMEEYLDKIEAGVSGVEWRKLAARILYRVKQAGGRTENAIQSSIPGVSEKQLAVITRYGDDIAKKAVERGDATACKLWLEEHFKNRG